MYDLIIRGERVVDGTGADSATADVAVSNGKIVEVGRVAGLAHRVIDADGLLVTPGWVDIHSHYDGQATWDPLRTPSFRHRVTTTVMWTRDRARSEETGAWPGRLIRGGRQS